MHERRALLFALAAIFLWGTLAAVVGDALAGLAPEALLFWCFLFAALALGALHLLRGGPPLQLLAAKPATIALGLWGIFGYHALFFEALAHAPIVQANLLNYLWPLLMVLLAVPLAREKLRALALAGAIVGFAGAVLVVTQGRSVRVDAKDALGYAFAALAALSWSSFSVLLRRAKGDEDRMALFTTWSLAAAAALALARGGITVPPPRALAAAAWVGVGPMAMAFVCWDRAMRLGRASTIGALSYLDPLLSTLCVAFALNKPLTTPTLVGMALIIGGAAAPALRRKSAMV
ncbi:MAG TPA: EamA family transporter [bacterium]|nr:EamA family transporter [bacterium]